MEAPVEKALLEGAGKTRDDIIGALRACAVEETFAGLIKYALEENGVENDETEALPVPGCKRVSVRAAPLASLPCTLWPV